MSNHSILRLTKEIGDIQKNSDLSLAVACQDQDVRHIKALIVGPPDTPYEFGFFEFSMKFGREYPTKAPAVQALTTNSGRCRFNPNIYASGKVCLSILGTWRGERGEEWSSAQGLESILISIQSLMSSNPYENEPGFENAKESKDKANMEEYILKIRHETLRVSIIQRLEEYLNLDASGQKRVDPEPEPVDPEAAPPEPPFEPFKDLIKRRFLMYYDIYFATIEEQSSKVKLNQPFKLMPFEHSGNTMDGKFNYDELKRRLQNVKKELEEETKRWIEEGFDADKKDEGIAVNLKRQFDQCVEHFKKEGVALDIELIDRNPFNWRVTYFGRPMTNLDGGLFNFQITYSTRFPEEQPRVKLLTPLFHYMINKDGIPCYSARRPEDARTHVEGIVNMLQEEKPHYDPRMHLNKEAAKLAWGTPEDRKAYLKRFRRDVERSMDF